MRIKGDYMELFTTRLKLKPVSLEDYKEIFLHFTDEITFYMYPKPPKDLDETIQFVTKCIDNYHQKNEIVFTVTHKVTHEFLGLIGVHEIQTKTPEIGLWLKKDAHGQHYGLEGVIRVIDFAKKELDYDYIVYNCDLRNLASRNIPESLNGIPMKTYHENNLSGKELHYIQYWIYKELPKNFKKPLVLFQGDSITDCNRNRSDINNLGNGYVKKISEKFNYIEVINKGISGNRTIDLISRWTKDTIDIKPDFISVLIGINEVWHHYKYGNVLKPSSYRAYYVELLEQIKVKLPTSKILMIEPFVFPIGEYEPTWEKDLLEEQKIVKDLSIIYADYYIPMQSIFNEALKNYTMDELLPDGVHPSDLGHELIAKAVKKELMKFLIDFYTKSS